MLGELKANVASGALVALIALPLCLGIAVASGFPPVAGLITAVIGGVVVGGLGGAELTIKGPAAGLIGILVLAVAELGAGDAELGVRRTLAVGVFAGALQVAFALGRLGGLAVVMPPAVVHGMLASIGVVVIAKQLPVMFGVQDAHGEPLEMLMHAPAYLAHANPEILLIGATALLAMIVVPRLPGVRRIPAPLVVVALGVPLGLAMHLTEPHTYAFAGQTYALGPSYLVDVPTSLTSALRFPDFAGALSFAGLKYTAMLALVGSIESLLTVVAVDALDPRRRASDLDRDLLVTGLGNVLAGMVGGLPMISEVVRSKANLDAGATGRMSNVVHGLVLLGCVALIPNGLHQIPLAALAGILVYTGARLASPNEFRHAWQIGPDQLGVFGVTFAVALGTDLLLGVGAGLLVKLAIGVARGGVGSIRGGRFGVLRDGASIHIAVEGPAVFTTLIGLRSALRDPGADVEVVVLDLSGATVIDHTFLDRVHRASEEWSTAKLEIRGLESCRTASGHPLAARWRA